MATGCSLGKAIVYTRQLIDYNKSIGNSTFSLISDLALRYVSEVGHRMEGTQATLTDLNERIGDIMVHL